MKAPPTTFTTKRVLSSISLVGTADIIVENSVIKNPIPAVIQTSFGLFLNDSIIPSPPVFFI
jgi:hypothetical protein